MTKIHFYLIAFSLILISACQPSGNKDITTNDVQNTNSADGKTNTELPDIKFDEETHDFGRITQGEKVSYSFTFKNTGGTSLIISSASGSCGCTVPEFPKKPILPGEEEKINVVFSSEGKSGLVEKSVSIVTNCEPSTKIIYIKADVVVPASANPSADLPTAH
jgi:hypothetical protein